MNLNIPLSELTLTAFDTETSGAYPLGAELCEIAAVKYKKGEIVDQFQSLVHTNEPMSDFIIGIHGITNEMVADAPNIQKVVPEFHKFIQNTALVAHHAPFDLGFLCYEFEKLSLMLPKTPVLCSSLLSRHFFPQSTNHKLQTLVEFFNLEKGVAHRALDDSRACLQVTLKCMEKFGWDRTFDDFLKAQTKRLEWKNFSIYDLQNHRTGSNIVPALIKKQRVELSYRNVNDKRIIEPLGIVRNPDGDYLVAREEGDSQQKRFYWNKIVAARAIS